MIVQVHIHEIMQKLKTLQIEKNIVFENPKIPKRNVYIYSG